MLISKGRLILTASPFGEPDGSYVSGGCPLLQFALKLSSTLISVLESHDKMLRRAFRLLLSPIQAAVRQ